MSSSNKHITITPVAGSIPFDNATNGFVSTDVQAAIEEVENSIGTTIRAGSIPGASFTGAPRKYTITFSPAFPSTNYSVVVTGGEDNDRIWTYESKTTTTVIINSNANKALVGNIDWIATIHGGGS